MRRGSGESGGRPARGSFGVGEGDDFGGGLPEAGGGEGAGPERRPELGSRAGIGDVRQARLAVRRFVESPPGLFGGEAVLHELGGRAGAGDQVFADGQVGVAGGGDALVDGDAVLAFRGESALGGHRGGVGPGSGGQSGVERDGWGTRGGAGGVDQAEEAVGGGCRRGRVYRADRWGLVAPARRSRICRGLAPLSGR